MKIHVASLVTSTLALTLLAGSVTAVQAAPIGKVHMHPQVFEKDSRVDFSVFNESMMPRQFVIDGRTYTVEQHRSFQVKAPVGTVIYAGFNIPNHRKGSVLMEVTGEMKGKVVTIG